MTLILEKKWWKDYATCCLVGTNVYWVLLNYLEQIKRYGLELMGLTFDLDFFYLDFEVGVLKKVLDLSGADTCMKL